MPTKTETEELGRIMMMMGALHDLAEMSGDTHLFVNRTEMLERVLRQIKKIHEELEPLLITYENARNKGCD